MYKFTKEDKARVFGMYLGCQSLYSDTPTPYPVNGSRIDDVREGLEYKLVLTPLSEITDEDAIEVAKLSGCDTVTDSTLSKDGEFIFLDGKIKYRIWFYNDGTGMDIYKNEEWHDCNTDSSFHWAIADFLRSKHYALPFKGQDLFTAGIAIKKTN